MQEAHEIAEQVVEAGNHPEHHDPHAPTSDSTVRRNVGLLIGLLACLMAITTVLAARVALQWGYNPVLVVMVNGAFLVVDLVFFAANAAKLLEGGWFPLVLAFLVAFVMMTWRQGQALVETVRSRMREPEDDFIHRLGERPPIRLPGVAVFLTAATTGIPLPMAHFVRSNHALHDRVLLVTVESSQAPRVPPEMRVRVVPVAPGIDRVVLRFGFTERPNVPEGLANAVAQGLLEPFDTGEITYVLGRETVIPAKHVAGMSHWREVIFALVQHNSERSASYFDVPPAQVVEMGTEIEI